MSIEKIPLNKCLNCNTNTTNNKFCCKSCSATYTNKGKIKTQETRDKISNSVKIRNYTPRINHQKSRNVKKYDLSPKFCKSCKLKIDYERRNNKTCSDECRSEVIRQAALIQVKHGSGKCGKYKGYISDSTYELAFIIYHLDHNILFERNKKIYSYIYKNKICNYIPDFTVNNITYEIKGFMSERAKAKLEQNPEIQLVPHELIEQYIKYVKMTYNVRKLEELYDNKIIKCV